MPDDYVHPSWAKWHVGQRVWCVRFSCKEQRKHPEIYPVVGEMYTIRDIIPHPDNNLGLLLEEIVNAPHQYTNKFGEVCFHELCFEPVKEQNIEMFRKIVRDISDGVPPRVFVGADGSKHGNGETR